MRVMTFRARQALTALDKTLSVTERVHLIGHEEIIWHGIGLIGESGMALCTDCELAFAIQFGRIDDSSPRITRSCGCKVLRSRSMAAFAVHAARLAGSERLRLPMTA